MGKYVVGNGTRNPNLRYRLFAVSNHMGSLNGEWPARWRALHHGVHYTMACTTPWRALHHGVHYTMACTTPWRALALRGMGD
jgi:hypothetical protein